MPDWYKSFGDYIYLTLSLIVICKSIWKVSPKGLFLNLLFTIAVWFLPYLLKYNHYILQYPIIFLMYAIPIVMVVFLHKKPIYHQYIEAKQRGTNLE